MVRVEYDYNARESDELTIFKGDVITDVVKKPGGWWEGTLNDQKGLFPDNFVKVIEKDITKRKKDSTKRKCKVIFSYSQDHEDELTLNVGDIVDIIGEEEEGWWRGFLHGKEGVFPSNFVEEIFPDIQKSKPNSQEDLTNITIEANTISPSLPPKPAKTLCRVNFSYKAQNDDELNLTEGDVVTLINKDGQDPGWWKGELNGVSGVFPDNFVAIITNVDDKKPNKAIEPTPIKPFSVASQRKSLELKTDKEKDYENVKITPPIPGKKPTVPIKKSPSSSSSSGGLFSGLRKKLVDAVDGVAASKTSYHIHKSADKLNKSDENENAFDQVERNSLLSDVRATRAKAPGRRPPSTVYKDGDVGIVNGNSDHSDHLSSSTGSVEQEIGELKPKVREWEKHKVPWLEEMKLNQAKRTSTSPGPEQTKLKLTPDKIEDEKCDTSPFETASPIDMSKSMPSLSSKLKTPPNELEKSTPPAIIHNKPTQQVQSSIRPTSIINSTENKPASAKTSPNIAQNKITSPMIKSQVNEKVTNSKSSGDHHQDIFPKEYIELLERIQKLEAEMERQNNIHKVAIEELRGKLQVETDMRMLLQAEVDRLSQCIMQV